MWELGYKESWAQKNWCFLTVVLEKTLESALDYKEIQPVNPKGNQSRIFIGRTDAEAEAPILWSPASKNWLIWKDPDAGKDWKQEEKRMTEDEMVGWHHQFDGHEFEQALGAGDGQGSLCAAIHGVAKSQTWLSSWTENSFKVVFIWIIFKVFIEILLLFYALVLWLWGMWDLESPSRDWAHTPHIGRWNLNHWTTREVPHVSSFPWVILFSRRNCVPKASLGPLKALPRVQAGPDPVRANHAPTVYMSLYLLLKDSQMREILKFDSSPPPWIMTNKVILTLEKML